MEGMVEYLNDVYILCACGYERRESLECLICDMNGRMAVLEEECKKVPVLEERVKVLEGKCMEMEVLKEKVREMTEECKGLKEVVSELRRECSVRPKGIGQNIASPQVIDRPSVESEWQIVRNKNRNRIDNRENPVEVQNRFKVLGAGREGEEPVCDTLGESSDNPEVLLIGDSQVRYMDREFCLKERKKRMRVCLPGAGVKDISDRYDRIVRGSSKEAIVVVHVGVNDIGKVRSVELVKRYREIIGKIRDSGRKCVVSGVLPRIDVGLEWMSRAIGLNDSVRSLCAQMDARFLDVWDDYVGEREMYAMDGLHLSMKGVKHLSKCLERVIGVQGN